MKEDWDNLVILDACRHDAFEDLNEIKGDLEKKASKASMTVEWLEKNLKEKVFLIQ